MEFRGKRVTVMGLGLFGGGSGVSTFLLRQGAQVTVTDLRSEEALRESVEALRCFADGGGWPLRLRLGGHDEVDFRDVDAVVVNPAVPKASPYLKLARAYGVRVIGRDNLFFQLCPAPILGITGSNGKTTTTCLIGEMLKLVDPRTVVGGNIGGSVFDHLDEITRDVPVVLELSSFQLEDLREIERSPHVAVVTNLSPNHIDRHGTFEEYVRAKKGIIAYQGTEDVAVLNYDDEGVRAWAEECRGTVLFFSMVQPVGYGAFVREGRMVLRWDGKEEELCETDAMALPGRHNVENALAAICAARIGGATNEVIVEVFRSFKGVEHRIEFVREVGGVRYFNDSIATTPESVIAALRSFEAGMVLIAGGYDKGLSFDDLAKEMVARTKGVVLIGTTASKLAALVEGERGLETTPAIVLCNSLEEAVHKAKRMAEPGDVVILSPACASYDMFRNFEDRGRQFKALVSGLD